MTDDPKTTFVSVRQEDQKQTIDRGEPQDVVPTEPNRKHVWLRRTRALLFVTICATFGVLLIILPWTPKWTDNSLLLKLPDLRPILSSGFFRGLCSGLGVLDLWLGFWEAIHYHEKR